MTAEGEVGAQLRKGVVEFCVLGLLQREPLYGWRLAERLIEAGLIGSIGTLYPLMARLRSRGLVSVQAETDESARSRRYYRLTAAGHQALEEFREHWYPFTRAVDQSITSPTGISECREPTS